MKKQVFNPYLPLNEYVPDGEPKVFGERLYIYGSHDCFGSQWYCLNDYVCYSAPINDLSDWRYEGVSYHKTQDPANKSGEMSMFAPDVVQGIDGRYYLYYGLDFLSQVSVAVSNSPSGPFEYYGAVQHADGTIYGSVPSDPFQFDPAVLVDDEQRVWLYTGFAAKDELIEKVEELFGYQLGERGNHVVELESDMLTLKSQPKQIIPNVWDGQGTDFEGHEFYEASSIRKFNGKYYFIYSSFLSHELAYAISDFPDRGFRYGGSLHSNGEFGNPGGRTEPVAYWGNNHGSIEHVNGKYYVFGHRQTDYTEFSRQGIAEEISYDPITSRFGFAELTSCGLNGGPLLGKGSYPASIACYLVGPDGAKKSVEVEGDEQLYHPCFTQEEPDGDEIISQYICNLQSGAWTAYKYFSFESETTISLVIRGEATGKLLVKFSLEEEPLAVVDVTSDRDWHKVEGTGKLPIIDKTALYLIFEGSGSLDIKEIVFE
ncbi:family 43 glycosylhydrolase [Streptococcus caprae]|uniref:Family 43 glycosylhydrolase n=1 Tax=Streptococcus caprae TaxID=1640501 RepID=A0ABV8CV97_9STRE